MKPDNKKIHLWIYNHPFNGISDQIDFFLASFAQHGYKVTLGRSPRTDCLNVAIENFSPKSKAILENFCLNTRKRVSIIMTEHLDFDSGNIFIHGNPLWTNNDYMHPATQINRIRYLFDCLPYIKSFLVLGDLPELRNFSTMLPGAEVKSVPFPKLNYIDPETSHKSINCDSDLIFTGYCTEYRSEIISEIKKENITIKQPDQLVSRKKRDLLNISSKLILNVPQREDWKWLSLMRIIAGLRCGRASISVATNDKSLISHCCEQINMSDSHWTKEIRSKLNDWKNIYCASYEKYMDMADSFEKKFPFPHDFIEYWSITDGIDT
ncbi:hypothetical protein [Chitinivorax sp. B]|uniref:hypothetical protein n=1 Tax=Chitinivorax sp. B TaxID=2502235 RepID=UPI0010F942FA|nr:hypothetical protein [Chitinivorax sp. B]